MEWRGGGGAERMEGMEGATHWGQRRAIAASYRYEAAPGDLKEMSGKRGQPSLSDMDGGPQTASRRNAQVNVI